MNIAQSNNELKIYRGDDYVVSDHIKIHQPSLNEICDYGESDYYSMIYQLTSTPQTMKYQLWTIGVDYTKITPFELFYNILYKLYPKERTSIIFGDLDLQKFQVMQRKDTNDILLYQQIENPVPSKDESHNIFNKISHQKFANTRVKKSSSEIIIDEYTYNVIVNYLRKAHVIEKDERMPANESTKEVLIEDAKEEYERNRNKEYHSFLKNLISSMVNIDGFKYNHSQVWDMKINAFMDSVKRISKIKNAELLLQSGYSGFGISLKDIDKKQLDWLGELE